jgi:hypothetical protein
MRCPRPGRRRFPSAVLRTAGRGRSRPPRRQCPGRGRHRHEQPGWREGRDRAGTGTEEGGRGADDRHCEQRSPPQAPRTACLHAFHSLILRLRPSLGLALSVVIRPDLSEPVAARVRSLVTPGVRTGHQAQARTTAPPAFCTGSALTRTWPASSIAQSGTAREARAAGDRGARPIGADHGLAGAGQRERSPRVPG